MPQGLALTIGLNAVDPNHYAGWSGPLNACEADADDMAGIARAKGFGVTTLLTAQATRAAVLQQLKYASQTLKSGDIFLLTYSGHGGQIPDLNGDEFDQQDETWCLFDGELLDDELDNAFHKFAAGVRIVVFSDSCHSGTVVKLAAVKLLDNAAPPEAQYRFMPPEVALRTYRNNRAMYDKLAAASKATGSAKARILLISGCQDNQLSLDGTFNGLFTGTLLRVWREGAFNQLTGASYQRLHKDIVRLMPPTQTPNFYRTGAPGTSLDKQKPFTI